MPLNILGDFFSLITLQFFDSISILLIISFVIWELPRSVKLISEEYTRNVYPEGGRVVDIVLFVMGLLCIFYLMSNAEHVVSFLKTPGITSFGLVLLFTLPLLIFLGFLKRLFGKMDTHASLTVFLVHHLLDLAHTVFFMCLALLVMPVAGYLLVGGR